MTKTVSTPLPPCAPLWFENIQLASKWYPCPGPRLPRGNQK